MSDVLVRRRSLSGHHRSRAAGARITGRRIARAPVICACCPHLVRSGEPLLVAVLRDGDELDVCLDCGPTPRLPSDPVRGVLDALYRAGCRPRRSLEGWTAPCPLHDWRYWRNPLPSLTVRGSPRGWAVVRCRAGCPTSAVLDALGLTLRDLFPPEAQP
jgi:hypothetical protein